MARTPVIQQPTSLVLRVPASARVLGQLVIRAARFPTVTTIHGRPDRDCRPSWMMCTRAQIPSALASWVVRIWRCVLRAYGRWMAPNLNCGDDEAATELSVRSPGCPPCVARTGRTFCGDAFHIARHRRCPSGGER